MIECLIYINLNDMSEAIRFCTSVQNDFVTYGDFMFWRGRVLLYSQQDATAKKNIQFAL
jgi:hypothetical protein